MEATANHEGWHSIILEEENVLAEYHAASATTTWKRMLLLRVALVASVLLGAFVGNATADDVAHFWNFDGLDAVPWQMHGGVQQEQAGPRPPEYPNFTMDNRAVRFDGQGYLSIPDASEDLNYKFTNGDAITLEAWVNLQDVRAGQPMYVIGKGRTGSTHFARDNQNWALRVVAIEGTVRASFLFATPLGSAKSHWHRWTTDGGFQASTGWHHIAVAYRFGSPDAICGWIDGQRTTGSWDMGGRTSDPPVVDDDAVWIGSSQGGNPGNSFRGLLDGVAVHRSMLSDETVASRFQRVGGPRVVRPQPARMPEFPDVPSERVLITISEGAPSEKRWLWEGETEPTENTRWLGEEFLLPRLPVQFDAWGIRDAWDAPVLVRMAADVQLPPGKHRFLVRTRSLSRLWVDGTIVAQTPAARRRSGNLEPIVAVPPAPVPGARVAGFVQQEAVGELTVKGEEAAEARSLRVVLEFLVGGKGLRTESGEVCVAVQSENDEWFSILRPGAASPLPLRDDSVVPALARIEQALVALDDQTRRTAAASQHAYWQQRHQRARDVAEAKQSPEKKITNSPSVDSFIDQKIQVARSLAESQDSETTRQFYEHVLPILRDNCFRCHGDKEQGGLRLHTRENALASGESEQPAVVPGDLAASQLIVRIRDGEMPPTGDGLTERQIETLERWVQAGAPWPAMPVPRDRLEQPSLVGDAAFLRRAYLDALGVPPDAAQTLRFLANDAPQKRQQLIRQLLNDTRFADHWVSFWMDLLAENPTLLNASLNSTGPFRWFLYDSLRDGKPIDQMVTELIMMRGDVGNGGSAGFGIAGENDSPLAAKAHILSSAFLGIELQCARCHDSPYHSTTQEDLYSLAAMLNREPLRPPKTSRVPAAFFQQKDRPSLIQVSLDQDQDVQPLWPFATVTGVQDGESIDALMMHPTDSRERLAALITGPANARFPRVLVNHVWKRLMGAGIVEPVNDWEGHAPSHPDLLDWLADQLLIHNYDIREVIYQIMVSQTYQREAVGENQTAPAAQRFFNAPDPRRLTAEQIVDSLFTATGRRMDVEELTFVHDGSHPMDKRLTLGTPRRAWMFASLNNERDRPSLSLPHARPIVNVLQAFGWTGSRQKPIAERNSEPNVLQPGILANGTLTMSLGRAAQDSELAKLALDAPTADALLDTLFLRFLTRHPDTREQATLGAALRQGFATRRVPAAAVSMSPPDPPLPQVTWTNHLVPEANEIQLERERRVRRGPPSDPRLQPAWREVFEDVVWCLINDREFVWIP